MPNTYSSPRPPSTFRVGVFPPIIYKLFIMNTTEIAWLNGASDNKITYTLLGKSNVISGALVYQRSDAKKETHFTPERVKELLATGSLVITEVVNGFPAKMELTKGDYKPGATYEKIDLGA